MLYSYKPDAVAKRYRSGPGRKLTAEYRYFFPASAFWPVWPGQSTVSVRRKTVQVHLIGAKPIVQVKK